MPRTTRCFILVAILVLGSAGLSLHLFLRLRALEDRTFEARVRLASFASVTSVLVQETMVTREDLLSAGVISTTREGDGFIVDAGGKENWGIKYLFDSDERLVGWQEYPGVRQPEIGLSNDLPAGPIDALRIRLAERRWRHEIIYQDD